MSTRDLPQRFVLRAPLRRVPGTPCYDAVCWLRLRLPRGTTPRGATPESVTVRRTTAPFRCDGPRCTTSLRCRASDDAYPRHQDANVRTPARHPSFGELNA